MKNLFMLFVSFCFLLCGNLQDKQLVKTGNSDTEPVIEENKEDDIPDGLFNLYGESVVNPKEDDYSYIRINFDDSRKIDGYFRIYDGTVIDSNGKQYDMLPQETLDLSSDKLVKYHEDEENSYYYKYGYKNSYGEVVIPAQFYMASEFSDGLAAVCRENGGCLEYINKNGDTVLTIEDADGYDNIFTMFPEEPNCDFSDGYAMINFGEYYIDKAGNKYVVNSEEYKACGIYSNGLIAVRDTRTELEGYANLNGELVIPCKYQWARPFLDCGVALVFRPEYEETVVGSYQGTSITRRGYINTKGDVVIPLDYYDAFYTGSRAMYPVSIDNDGIIMLYKDGCTCYFRYDGTFLGKIPHMSEVEFNGKFYPINLAEYWEWVNGVQSLE